MKPKFIVDLNVGRLARKLRMLGYDATVVTTSDDNDLIRSALRENRIILTRDTGILRRRVVTTGKVKAILVRSDDVRSQVRQVVQELGLKLDSSAFSRCIECNRRLVHRTKEEIRDLVPPYVFETQQQYFQCPACRRVYWQGTHWEKMNGELQEITEATAERDVTGPKTGR